MHETSDGARPTPGRTRLRSRWALTALAAALVVGGLGALWLRDGGGDLPRQRPDFFYGIGSLATGSTDFQVGEMYIEEKGSDIEILAVEALTSPNVQQLGAIAVWPRDLGASEPNPGSGRGFPDPRVKRHHPAFGTVIPAAEVDFTTPGDDEPRAIVVAAGFRLVSGEVGAVNGLLVRYRVGGDTKKRYFPYAAFACVANHPCGFDDTENGGSRVLEFEQRTLVEFGLVPRNAYS